MTEKSDKGLSLGPQTLLVFIAFFAVVSVLIVPFVIPYIMEFSAGQDVTCSVFCSQKSQADRIAFGLFENPLDPRNKVEPKSLGCYCGVSEDRGKFLHARWDSGGPYYEFHLTNQEPRIHKDYSVPGNGDHTDNCPEAVEPEGNGCFVYAVDFDGGWGDSDDCVLYKSPEGAAINGSEDASNTGWILHEFETEKVDESTDGNFENPLSAEWGQSITMKSGDNVHKWQRYLLNDPTGDTLEFWEGKDLVCKKIEVSEKHVPSDNCAQSCDTTCSEENKLYWDSKCASEDNGPEGYRQVSGNSGCGSESSCYCDCVGQNRYYWEVVGEDEGSETGMGVVE